MPEEQIACTHANAAYGMGQQQGVLGVGKPCRVCSSQNCLVLHRGSATSKQIEFSGLIYRHQHDALTGECMSAFVVRA